MTTRNKAKGKKKKAHKITWLTAMQSLFLTTENYLGNNLFSYSSACTFGFLFSFIPTLMIIVVILIRFLHASPDTVINFINDLNIFAETFDLTSVVEKILSIKKITNFEIIMGLGIIWMARRFFSSIMAGMNSIYTRATPSKPVFNQILILAVEAIFIVVSSVLILTFTSFNSISNTAFITKNLPFLFTKGITRSMQILPYVFIFIVILFFYKEMSIGKVSWKNSAISAAGSTFTFWAFQQLLDLFINVNKYNIVYGVLSKVVVLLMEICFFFWIFFFFAQFLFVLTYFDELLLGELYVLPNRNDTGILASIKRILFIRPDYMLNVPLKTLKLNKDDFIYKKDSSEDYCYYIAKGTVQLSGKNYVAILERGDFFGEEACIIGEPHNLDAIAYTDCEIIRIAGKDFRSLLQKNPLASKKALSKVSSYFSKIYKQKQS